MENWEFLLQRKGDKSWLPLESPTVEILESQYRLAARSDVVNVSVAIAIAYRPLADVRHEPFQQKIVKRISHDGLLIVMPYTNFVPGLWQIDCCAVDTEIPAWKKTVKFDVIKISSEAGSEWQYSDLPEEDLEYATDTLSEIQTNALGLDQTDPTPISVTSLSATSLSATSLSATSLSATSPILDIAEQRSTELVQSMFDEFALFNDEINGDNPADRVLANLGDRPNVLEPISLDRLMVAAEMDAPQQPRILLRLHQLQYIVNADNSFTLTGEAYTKGDIEVSLKDPQTLDVIVHRRYAIANLSDRAAATGAIPFTYQVIVPPPSEIQVLIGEVQIYPQQDFQQYGNLFVDQQAIAVSYPASRVLPEMIKEAQEYSSQTIAQPFAETLAESTNYASYPQFSESFPQAATPIENPLSKPRPANSLSLPPLPSNKPKTSGEQLEEPQRPKISLSLPPLPPLANKPVQQNLTLPDAPTTQSYTQSFPQEEFLQGEFPQGEIDALEQVEAEFARIDLLERTEQTEGDRQNVSAYAEEPELLYSFEDELPQNYEELLEQPRLESAQMFDNPLSPPNKPTLNNLRDRGNRFLNKLQILSAEAIAFQKASQRNDDLLLDTYVDSDPLEQPEILSGASIDLDNAEQQPFTIAEANSFAELDLELDLELDRLLAPEPDRPDLILNEYVWEETVDPNTFPIPTVSTNSAASALVETAQTIRNIQESLPQSLSEQEPIPIPEILIPAGEIISGTPMLVTVRLPAIAPKFFVKFWIKDLQTRMIVDGPRWLLDFSIVPNTEFIETRTNISIPLSSIDVAFEAIAIEAQTQRESHKVRIIRAVTPPNLAQDIDFD